MNCGSTNDTTDFLANGDKMILCVNDNEKNQLIMN